MNPVFSEEEDEGFSGGPPCTNIIVEDSVVEIGNKVEFNADVVILPDDSRRVPVATAEHVFNSLHKGEIQAKNIDEEFGGRKIRK